MPPTALGLTITLADLDFAQTKSVGIFNLATGLARYLAASGAFSRLTVLSNPTLGDTANWPGAVANHSYARAPESVGENLVGSVGRV